MRKKPLRLRCDNNGVPLCGYCDRLMPNLRDAVLPTSTVTKCRKCSNETRSKKKSAKEPSAQDSEETVDPKTIMYTMSPADVDLLNSLKVQLPKEKPQDV